MHMLESDMNIKLEFELTIKREKYIF